MWTNLAIPLLLALLVAGTRWPVRSQYLFNWDSANFALAFRDFDVTKHAPHPPGYPYYVGLGKLLNIITHEANAALVLESVLFSILAVLALYFLGKAMFSPLVGLGASLLLAGSVTFWTYGELALAYPALAFFSPLVALLAYRNLSSDNNPQPNPLPWGKGEGRERFETSSKERLISPRAGGGLLMPLAAAYAVAGGFRPDLLLFLAPLFLAACYGKPRRTVVTAFGVAFLGVFLWLIPTALLSGGVTSYWAALSAYTASDVLARYSPTHRGLEALSVNIKDTASYTFYGLYAISLPLLGAALRLLWPPRPPLLEKRGLFLLGWVSPMVLFYLFVHVGDPGYVFSFLPGVMLAVAWGWGEITPALPGLPLVGKKGLVVLGLVLVIAANAGIFLAHDRPLTARGIRANDASLEAKIEYIRSVPSDGVFLLAYESYKHLLFYLPEYPHRAWVDLYSPKEQVVVVPEGVREVILVDMSLAKEVLGAAVKREQGMGRVLVKPGSAITYRIPKMIFSN